MDQAGAQPMSPRDFAVEASAEIQNSPPAIRLRWPVDVRASGYLVARKSAGARSWGVETSLPGSATEHTDTQVSAQTVYEYKITKIGSDYFGYGYISAGIQVPLVEHRGTVLLIVENTYAADLAFELARLQQDLIGDGWKVIRRDVARSETVRHVKDLIKAEHGTDPANTKAVFLFGHVPVPYSGDIAPDEHPLHEGAWPADSFYADIDGAWTDITVNTTRAEREENWNVPGDGKFDQSTLPSDLELQVGRVDLANMTAFGNKSPARSERDLLRQYLNKNHQFRHRQFTADRRALICDNFGLNGDPISSSAWRNFAPFFGAENISTVGYSEFFPSLTSQSYLWSFGAGGGSYTTCDGIGSSDDFAQHDLQTVFTMFLGSFFGDWDNESNFLRASLGSGGYTLAAIYSGFPHWVCHHMALGETLGFSTLVSQTNRPRGLYPPVNVGSHQVHIALLGDPTLRMHPVIAPGNVTGSLTATGLKLDWSPSSDSDLLGYHVYRSSSVDGPFSRINGEFPVQGAPFTDVEFTRAQTYMVRAVKLERSASGTYVNASQGVFFSTGRLAYEPLEISPARSADGRIKLRFSGPAGQQFVLEGSTNFVDWQTLVTNRLSDSTEEFIETNAVRYPSRFYRARKAQE